MKSQLSGGSFTISNKTGVHAYLSDRFGGSEHAEYGFSDLETRGQGKEHPFYAHRVFVRLSPALLLLFFLSGCTCHLKLPNTDVPIQTEAQMMLDGHTFKLHLSKPSHPAAGNVMIVYATGDGGWLWLSSDIFHWLASWNYPVAGFSSTAYLNHLDYFSAEGTTTPGLLVRDYQAVIAFAKKELGLPQSTKIILVGYSRGAGLAVVAAGEGSLDNHMAGLLAIALTKEEEHVYHRPRKAKPANSPDPQEVVMIDTYHYLDRPATYPVMVIQSTHDGYLPSDAARKFFGPDTELRRLRAVESTNHSFHKGCQTLYQDAENGLKWMIDFMDAHGKD